jgi:hypothetical protein
MSTAELDSKSPRARGAGAALLDSGFYGSGCGIADFRFERARAANFRYLLHAGGGRAARCPEGHATVVHGANQRREMCTAGNRNGCTTSGPVAFKRYIVGGGGLRVRQSRLRTEYNGYKEKTRQDPKGTTGDEGEA